MHAFLSTDIGAYFTKLTSLVYFFYIFFARGDFPAVNAATWLAQGCTLIGCGYVISPAGFGMLKCM